MNKAKEMVRGRIANILYSPGMCYGVLDTGMKMKKLKASVAPES